MAIVIGVDVGGTNTDAVVLDGDDVITAIKSPTTQDVTSGIVAALTAALANTSVSVIESVFIGTTHFINAIAQRRGLAPVATVRLATPPQSLGPMIDWPTELRAVIDGGTYVCAGGAQFDGTLLNELDETALHDIARQIRASGVRHVALSSIFAPVNPASEIRAAAILRELLPGISVTESRDVGRIGLLARENATILNAALMELADHVVSGLEDAVRGLGIEAPILLSQNDGTVMTLDRARRFPIFTIASGPTNSMRGAAFLTGVADAVIVDVGGTTSDVGVLQSGFPRESTVAMSLAGVRSNFRIPDVLSIALGGGTTVSPDGAEVGPESVGYRISQEAIVFGGSSLTFTDVAVRAGVAGIGDAEAVAQVDDSTTARALRIADERLMQAIERVKVSADHTPIIAVGGGAALLAVLPSLSDVTIPSHAGVANAIGAAFAEIGGEVDRVVMLGELTREQTIESAKAEARELAIAAGADPDAVRLIEVEDVPLAYLPGGIRIRVKAIGPFRATVATSKGL